jgi:hypothetical protein
MTRRRASTTEPVTLRKKERFMKQFITGGLAAVLIAGGLITAAPPASAGCLDPGWAAHPLAQMCDDPISADGMWQRCVTYLQGGPLSAGETDCYLMSAGEPPLGADPIMGNPPTHIDP